MQFTLLVLVLGFAASHRHWFALAFAVRLLFATLKVCSGKATERDHQKVFVSMANWELFFLVSLHPRRVTLEELALLTVVASVLILANVGYFYDRRSGRLLMLRFGRAKHTS